VPENLNFAKATIDTYRGKAAYYDIRKLKELGYDVDRLPYSIKVLLENALRSSGRDLPGASEATRLLASWPKSIGSELPFMPYRVLLQDYTGVPLIVDLAGMRSAFSRSGRDPKIVNSKIPVDLIIDHSVQVDSWGALNAIILNLEKEYERNSERYLFLKWAQLSFSGMRIFPPGKGICHQVNLEYLANVAVLHETDGELAAFPDTLLGTDSHTTMVNGLGVLGWGVGGIEAEAVMLGEPYYMPIPKVIGVKFTGQLQEGATPTDLVLTVTEALRRENVVGAFVEYFGDAYSQLSVPDRATIGNMSPEYGATAGYSPIDQATIEYLLATGRKTKHAEFVKEYCLLQGLFLEHGSPPATYSKVIEVDLSKIEPSIAGPRNPDERVTLRSAPSILANVIAQYANRTKAIPVSTTSRQIADDGYQLLSPSSEHAVGNGVNSTDSLRDGSIVIAAITSCTNTSNPTVMIGAGLLAKKAIMLGLKPKKYVKRSLAPGSTVVTDYLTQSNLLHYLEQLGFDIVGYGCTTCIGNSGPLAPEIEKEIKERDLYSVAVLSGNRNFDGRIHPLVRGSFLMSPMLVVAYSLAGQIRFDFSKTPLGTGSDGTPVFLKDIWPSMKEIRELVAGSLSPQQYKERYANPLEGDKQWLNLKSPSGDVYGWDTESTYIREPPWFTVQDDKARLANVDRARILAIFEDKVTTDHISPAGAIAVDSPAGIYLQNHGVPRIQFSTYGSRRGNHEVMVRGGFSNIRLNNIMAKGKEGGWTTHYPSEELMTIYDAAVRYENEHVPLIILAGKQYGAGSSRDWAAKAAKLLGVRAVIAESFERIHRSNLVAMGVLPLEFSPGETWKSLGLEGDELFSIEGISEMRSLHSHLTVRVSKKAEKAFHVLARLDNNVELEYYRDGGVLPFVFSKLTT
jgi:aconitate hydratase